MSSEIEIDKTKILVIIALVVVIGLVGLTAMASIKIVDAGNRGVLTHWNAVDFNNPPMEPGIHFVTPFQDNVIPMNIQVQATVEKANSASKDLQIVTTQVTVNNHPDPTQVAHLYQNVGFDYSIKVISPAIQETVKAVTAKYNAEELITERPAVKQEIEDAIKIRLDQFGIMTDQVSITDFDFSPDFNTAIEAKVKAQQDALTAENTVRIFQAQAQQAIAQAQGIANSTIAKAEGDKQAKILNAEGEGKSIEIINQYLAQNPQYLEWLKTQKWNGQLPSVLVSGQNGVTPFINIPSGVISNVSK